MSDKKKYVVVEMDIYGYEYGGRCSKIFGPFDSIEEADNFEKLKHSEKGFGLLYFVEELIPA